MARYIDADKLANDIYRAWELWEKKGEDCYIFAEVITPMLVGQPTADVVEVVRCKDCDYSMGITEKKCPMWENIGDPNGYCKWCDQQLSSINER